MIVLDIDGVVANPFNEVNYFLETLGYETKVWTSWESDKWSEVYNYVNSSTMIDCINSKLIYKNALPFEESWYWTNHYSSTYDIMYLSARPETMSQLTWDWFMDWDIPADFVVFQKNKVEFLEQLYLDIYIDDNPQIVIDAFEKGIPARLINRPYNLTANIDPKLRINSLWDIDFNENII